MKIQCRNHKKLCKRFNHCIKFSHVKVNDQGSDHELTNPSHLTIDELCKEGPEPHRAPHFLLQDSPFQAGTGELQLRESIRDI
jgi:hypothetical protein